MTKSADECTLKPMPDLDRLPRGLRPAWRAVADALRGQQPPAVVADAVEKALAKTLRRSGGLEWLPDLAQAVASCRAQHSVRPLERAANALDRGTVTGVGAAFVEAAWSLSGTVPDSEGSIVVDELVIRGLERMIDKLCIGPLEPGLVPGIFASSAQLRDYVALCVAAVQLEDIAQRLTRSGCSGRIRAPRTRLARPGTGGLLHAPLQ